MSDLLTSIEVLECIIQVQMNAVSNRIRIYIPISVAALARARVSLRDQIIRKEEWTG